jgi:hypothetical protein
LGERTFLSVGLDPSVAVCVLDDLVRDLLDIALDLRVCELATDETLCGEEGVFRVDDGLTLSGNADQTLAIFCESNYRRGCAGT